MAVNTANLILSAVSNFEVDGTSLGGTEGGLTVTKKQTTVALNVDQIVGTAALAIKDETYTVTTMLAEATLANLQIAWSNASAPVVATSPASTTLNLDATDGSVVEHVLVFTGKATPGGTAGYKTRTFTFNRAINVSVGKAEFSKDKQTVFEVEFQCLPDMTKSSGQYGTVVDS